MIVYEYLESLAKHAKAYVKNGVKYVKQNCHMNEITPDDNITQEQMEAVVVDFINFVGARQGVDFAMYTSDLADAAPEQKGGQS